MPHSFHNKLISIEQIKSATSGTRWESMSSFRLVFQPEWNEKWIQVFVLAKNFDHMKEKICLPSEDFTANVVENSSHFGMHKWMQWILMYFFGFKGKKVIYNIDKKAPNRWTDDEPTNASQGR